MKTIAIANRKGGVGKTTTAINLAAGLALKGNKTLLIDFDPQANATDALIGNQADKAGVYEFLMREDYPLEDVVIPSGRPNLDILPARGDLAGAERALPNEIDGRTRLRDRLASQKNIEQYDYVVIDAPPSLGYLTTNALAAASEVIIPVEPDRFSLTGLNEVLGTIGKVKKYLNPNLKVRGILRNKYDQTNIARDVDGVLQRNFGSHLIQAVIPRNVTIKEAQGQTKSVYEYDPRCKGAIAFAQFVEEVATHE